MIVSSECTHRGVYNLLAGYYSPRPGASAQVI